METSPEIGTLAAALSKTQGMMKAAQLDGTNPFFNSRYSTLAAIIEASRQPLAANSLAIVQGVSTEGEPLVVKISTMLIHSSNQWIRETLTVRPAKVGIHELASAITYSRRIALASLLAIYADDDDGNLAADIPANSTKITPLKKVKSEKSAGAETETRNTGSPIQMESQQPSPNKLDNCGTSPEYKVGGGVDHSSPMKVSQRAGKIRDIFMLSNQLGHSPAEMKTEIGSIIGLGKQISDSSQIKDDQLDLIVNAFRKSLDLREKSPRKEAA